MRKDLASTIARLPKAPGVYLMKGREGEVLYIGKATDLRSRVRSYFGGNDPRAFVQYLDELLGDIDYVLTSNPKEALLLENTLIKRHKPRFNFMLRDDKNYLAIRIDERHEWPRVELVRSIRRDGARYFGPYHSAAKVRQMLNVLNRHFSLRTCNDTMLRNRSRPCLQYQIRRCPGPCAVPVDRAAYMDNVRHAELFLEGREAELVEVLASRMIAAAEALEFEEAARYRDQRAAVEASLERQGAVQTSQIDRDVVGMYREADDLVIVVVFFRNGSLDDVRTWPLGGQVAPDADIVASFVGQLYTTGDRRPPSEVLLPCAIHDTESLESALGELSGRRCRVMAPQRGDKVRLVTLANENARAAFGDTMSTSAQAERALERIAKRLGLAAPPRTIECYDISNLQGTEVVASRVVFQDALPDRARYRRVIIRSVDGQDDFGSMSEVITRRVARAAKSDDPMPDLIVIDGGKGQLNAAVAALASAGASGQPVVALAKSRVTGRDAEDAVVRSSERVFVPGRKNPVLLHEHSPECRLLARIRDEAHRHAIEYHRMRRRKRTLRSGLEDVRGIGEARRNALLQHFGSLQGVRRATLVELERVPGFSRAMALAVFAHFHPGEADG